MPMPPPWWMHTQVAPAAVLTSALSSGQSAIASEPSRMPSVSRLGEATEPRVEVVAPDDDRRLQLAAGHQLVERRPGPAPARRSPASRCAPAVPGRRPSPRPCVIQRRERLVLREELQDRLVGAPDVRRDRRTAPPSGRAPCPRRRAAGCRPGTKPGKSKAFGHAGGLRLGADVVAVVEGHRARRAGSRAWPARGRPSRPSSAGRTSSGSAPRSVGGLVQRQPGRDVAVQRVVGATSGR